MVRVKSIHSPMVMNGKKNKKKLECIPQYFYQIILKLFINSIFAH